MNSTNSFALLPLPIAELNGIEDVQRILGLGRSKLFELIADGELRAVKVGRRTLISRRAIEEFLTRIGA